MKRSYLMLAFAATLGGRAWAQVDLSQPASTAAGGLAQEGISTNTAKPQNPMEPSGFPELPSRENELPPPREYGPDERVLQIVEGGHITRSGSKIHGAGGFHAKYRGYDIFGDTVDGDTVTNIFTLSGNVRILGADEVIRGEKVTVNFNDNTFRSEASNLDLHPSFFPVGRVLDDVYAKSLSSYGSKREVFGDYTRLTTCNLPDPHFELVAKSTDVRPGRRIIMRDVQLWILKHHVLTIPYLSIPLDDRSSRYTPEVGHSADEGYYIKNRVPIALKSRNDFLDSRIDYYTRLGTGLGLDYNYQSRLLSGLMQTYHIFGPSNEFEFNGHHDERFGHLQFSFDGNYQKNNYLVATNASILNLRSSLTLPLSNGSMDQLTISRSSNSSQGFSSLQQVLGFNDNRVFNRFTRSTLNLSYTDNSSNGTGTPGIESKELDVRFDATSDLKRAQAELQYMRNIPVGQNNNTFFGVADQTPVFTLRSDSNRLLPNRFATILPFQTDVSWGQFGTPAFFGTGAQHVTRTNFDFNFNRPDNPSKRLDFNLNGRFQQGIYSDDAAQYATGVDSAIRYTLGRDTSLNLRYNYLQQHGFTPLDFDRTGQTNLFTMDASVRPFHSLLVAAQSGYDLLQIKQGNTPWQSFGVRSEWTPRSWFVLRGLATYDSFQQAWSNIRFDLGYKPGATFVSAGLRYDGIQKKVGDFNLFVDGFKWGRLKTSMIIDYDGYLHQFTARHFSFTYDLHCAEAILQILDNPVGFRPGTQIAFYFRLKAFPFNTPFGVGNRGQAVGAGTGRDFF